jgi:enoyl-CoA hydratase/carnithine racemase
MSRGTACPIPLLLIHDADGIRTITIHRPDKLNALNAATLDALDAAFADAACGRHGRSAWWC